MLSGATVQTYCEGCKQLNSFAFKRRNRQRGNKKTGTEMPSTFIKGNGDYNSL